MLQVGEGSGRIQSYRFSRIVPGMVSRNPSGWGGQEGRLVEKRQRGKAKG